MYHYITGTVTGIFKDHIILDHHGTGFMIYVANPYDYHRETEYRVYVYQVVREDAILLYGFQSEDEKSIFLRLIQVRGVGPKTAIGILACGDYNKIVGAIEDGNISYLKKIPGIGPKAAQQIVLDLKGKLVLDTPAQDSDRSEAEEVLKALGYRPSEIASAMRKINEKLDTNGYVKKALSLLVR